jgi:hypothetical protein
MSLARPIRALALAIGLSLGLTACDPPIPASLLVAQAELTVQCEEGNATAFVPEALYDTAMFWVDAAIQGCENMTIELVSDPTQEVDLVISEAQPTKQQCSPFETVPIAIDAGVLVVNIPDVYELNLSAQQIIGIFDGSITNWSDERLYRHNEELELPDLPIILPTQATPAARNSISEWISRLSSQPFELSSVSDPDGLTELEIAAPEEEGSLAIASYGAAAYLGSTIVGIVTQDGDIESLVIPQYESLYSGITQLVTNVDTEGLSLKLDPAIEPIPEEGLTEAEAAFQSVFPLSLSLCGEDNLLTRTAARFLLRRDSQGLLAAGTFMPLREDVRISVIQLVAIGLPTPTPVVVEEGQ